MKTKRGVRSAALILAVAASLACTTAAYAEYGPGPRHHGPGRGEYGERSEQGERGEKGDPFNGLDLTTEQRDQLKAQREAAKAEKDELRESMKTTREALKAELDKETLDMARVNAVTADLKALTAKMVDMRVQSIIALKGILTPEQFRKMQDKMEHHKGKMGGKHHKW